jgi:hypothetical protein
MSDVATALTGSVAADGQTTITGPLKGAVGSAGAPGFSFAGRVDTGMWSPAAGAVAWSVAGAECFRANVNGLSVNGTPPSGTNVRGISLNAVTQAVADLQISGVRFATFNSTSTQANLASVANIPLGIGANNTIWFNVTVDGRLYGTALHNNAGAVTGTTNQYVASGTYTPTLTAVSNVAATTARSMHWIRVGNVVTVAGHLDVDPTAASSTVTQVGISIPIASDFANIHELGGTAYGLNGSSTAQYGGMTGDVTNNRAQLDFLAGSASNNTWTVTFTYVIL